MMAMEGLAWPGRAGLFQEKPRALIGKRSGTGRYKGRSGRCVRDGTLVFEDGRVAVTTAWIRITLPGNPLPLPSSVTSRHDPPRSTTPHHAADPWQCVKLSAAALRCFCGAAAGRARRCRHVSSAEDARRGDEWGRACWGVLARGGGGRDERQYGTLAEPAADNDVSAGWDYKDHWPP